MAGRGDRGGDPAVGNAAVSASGLPPTTPVIATGDAVLIVRCLHLIGERCERTSTRLRGLAPELRARPARLLDGPPTRLRRAIPYDH